MIRIGILGNDAKIVVRLKKQFDKQVTLEFIDSSRSPYLPPRKFDWIIKMRWMNHAWSEQCDRCLPRARVLSCHGCSSALKRIIQSILVQRAMPIGA
jgi:hypothetical protein